MSSVQSWMMTWIPIAATVLIIVSAIAWIAHMLPASWAVRIVIGLIIIGSASYLVGLFGLS
ncbi:TPA: TrbC/VirB2 family protein [Escherichia coli]